MDRTNAQYQIPEGTDVFGSDGEKVGKVIASHTNYVVVEKGFFFPSDYYIPTSAIASFDGGNAYLSVSKDEALNSGWNEQPADSDWGATATTGYETTTATTGFATADTARSDVGDRFGEQPFTHDSHPDQTHVHAGDTISVPVHEEELTATKRPVEMGEVRIEKDVLAEERVLDVPVTEERVRVTRRTVDRDATGADATAFEGGTIAVPVRGEEVELQKRVRVAEEVEVGKEAVQRTERVAGTVRREEVRVDDATVADVTDGTTGTTTSNQ